MPHYDAPFSATRRTRRSADVLRLLHAVDNALRTGRDLHGKDLGLADVLDPLLLRLEEIRRELHHAPPTDWRTAGELYPFLMQRALGHQL
ncbi:MAG TPA: hypothetical protein VM913_08740 [Sphingomicrobium sp.]|jgi:hypothetical protein|nr:hypothetical protein [Sphingomicrobium sp.]